jgi:hypothetical protein
MQIAQGIFVLISLDPKHQQFRWIPICFQAYAHPHLSSTAGKGLPRWYGKNGVGLHSPNGSLVRKAKQEYQYYL